MSLPTYIGRYEVRHEIARGGFAEVVLAWDEDLQASVAIKILHPQFVRSDDDIQQRFLEEARLLRRIRSPNVVTIHDVGRLADGRPYFVMDFADRGTLATRFAQGSASARLDTRSLSILVDALADGLSGIHDAGVVHRDVKPANILFQLMRRAGPDPDETVIGDAGIEYGTLVAADERVLLGDLGIAKDLLRGGASTLIGGTFHYRAPEQAEENVEITAAADVYSASAVLWEAITKHRPPHPDAVVGSLSALPPAWREVLEAGLAFDPKARFSTIDSWRSAVQDVLSQQAAESDTHVAARLSGASMPCPYKGLASYQPEDAHSFFGREVLIDELVRRLQLQNVLVVGGPSGSGKSSLVRAGLIPALKAGAIMGSEAWPVVLLTPGRDPMGELYFQFSKTLPEGTPPPVTLADLMARPALARHLGRRDGPSHPIVVCIDQFEEVFTLAPADQRAKMIEALSAMTDPAHSPIRLILTVRADFYATCAEVPWLAERITENQVLVGPMTEAELRRAISEPARRVGLYLERSLIDAVISEVGNEAGALPLVAHAMVETWMRRRGSTLTLEGFRAAGGVAGAISQTADLTFAHRFDDAEKAASKRLFLRLVTPGEGTSDTRRVLVRSEIESDPDPDVVRRVIEGLTAARLLTVSDTTVQIAHEALLRTWPRLRDWIEDSRDNLRTRQRISRAAEEWDAEGRDPDRLYRGAPLLSALAWVESHGDQLSGVERAFIDASSALADRQRLEAREKEVRARRRRNTAIGALGVLAASATVASIVAFLAFRQAEASKVVAEHATAEANERFAGALGAVAKELVEEDPLLALYLAAESVTRSVESGAGFDARASLLGARLALSDGGPAPLGSPVDMGDARVLALSPDGSLLAAGGRDGSLSLASTGSRAVVATRAGAHDGGIEDLDFGPRSDALATAGDDGKVRLWTPSAGLSQSSVVASLKDVVWGVRISPDGHTVASAAEDGTVAVWDLNTSGEVGGPLIDRDGDVLSVAFDPGGRGLVAGNGEGDIVGWALPERTPLFPPIKGIHTSDIWKLAFDPLGRSFATSSSDGKSNLFAYPSGKLLGPVMEPGDEVAGVAFSTDGSLLYAGGADGGLRVWNVRAGKLVKRTRPGHDGPIVDLKLNGERNIVATLARDRLVRFWRADARVPLSLDRRMPQGAAKGLALSPNGTIVAAGGEGGTIALWTGSERRPALLQTGGPDQVWAIAFSPDGKLIVAADRGGRAVVWDVASGQRLAATEASGKPVWTILVDAASETFLTVGDDGIREFGLRDAVPRRSLWTAAARVNRAALSPDGTRIAVASSDAKLRLIDRPSGEVRKEIAVDRDAIWSVAFDRTGTRLAVASGDEVVSVWDIETATRLTAVTGHSGGATDVAFLPDGVSLAAIDRQGRLHLLDITTGRRIVPPWPAHQGASWRLAARPDDARFATAGDDGVVRLWDVLDIERACIISRETFDEARRKEYFGTAHAALACRTATP